MTNTNKTITNQEQTPIIYPEMEKLLPYLNEEEYQALEADILQNGCYTPITVNQNMVIIDGHHRYRICQKHNLPFKMQVFEFEDLPEAKQWALDTQRGRRNLTKWQLAKIAMQLRPELVEQAKANQGARTDLFLNSEKSVIPVNSTKAMADSVKIGADTMSKALQVKASGLPAVEQALDEDAISIHRAYKIVKEVERLPEDQRQKAAADAVQNAKNGVSFNQHGEYVPREFYDAVENGEIRQKDSGLLMKPLLDARPEDRDEMVEHVLEGARYLAESDRRIERDGAAAKYYCSVFEKAALLVPSRENVAAWVKYTRMTPEEIEMSIRDCYELSQTFRTVGDILKAEFLSKDPKQEAIDLEETEAIA